MLLITISVSFAQSKIIRPDTVICNDVFTSYYSIKYHCPLVVQYRLYQGGGDCQRGSTTFKATPITATSRDYAASGYDSGHMCNAEDMAYDCAKQKLTFSYYNCVPQTPALNRGSWKAMENVVRKLSQKDSLIVTCGSVFGANPMKIGHMYIPIAYWKVVQSARTKKVLLAVMYTNTKTNPLTTVVSASRNAHIKRGMSYTN